MISSLVKLKDVATIIAGQSPAGKNYNNNGEGMPFYQGKKDYGDKFLNPPKVWTKSITKVAIKGDILLSVRAPVGALNIATQEICIGRGLAAIRVHEEINEDYLFYVLSQISIGLTGNAGAIFNSINKTQIENIEFLLPPLAEQERIVAKLDAAFAEIDKSIKIIDKNISSYSNLLSGIMREVLNNDLYKWEIKKLPSLSANLDSKRIPITKSKRVAGNIPYYGASGIVDYVEEFLFDDDLLLISEDGANLLMRSHPIAFSIVGKSWVNNHAHVLKFKNLQLQEWVELYLNSINLSPYISGMAQPKLNQKKLNGIPIPCPHSEMLDELLNIVVSTKKNIDEILVVEAQKINELKKLKSAMLSQELQSKEAA